VSCMIDTVCIFPEKPCVKLCILLVLSLHLFHSVSSETQTFLLMHVTRKHYTVKKQLSKSTLYMTSSHSKCAIQQFCSVTYVLFHIHWESGTSLNRALAW